MTGFDSVLINSGWKPMESVLSSFEEDCSNPEFHGIRDFLPAAQHPQYSQIVSELIRIDLEYAWERGEPRELQWYDANFPCLLNDLEIRTAVEFEIRRLREISARKAELKDSHDENTIMIDSEMQLHFQYFNPGDLIGDFMILKRLGRGSRGDVYLANHQEDVNRKVVLKFTGGAKNEAQLLGKLRHRNIIPVLCHKEFGNTQAVCMPYLGDLTLKDIIHQHYSRNNRDHDHTENMAHPHEIRSMSYSQSLVLKYKWIMKIIQAAGHVHENGMIHRDIKPANILISFQNEPMLIDFNMAVRASAKHVSHHGGTPAYMAPEQAGSPCRKTPLATFCSDIYSIGVVMLELLTGKLPSNGLFDRAQRATIPQELTCHKLHTKTQSSVNAVAPLPLALLRKCLSPDPRRRYQKIEELYSDLVDFFESHNDFSTSEVFKRTQNRDPLF